MGSIENRYLRAIRSRVCHNCGHLLPDGMCGLGDRVCPIERNLRDILQIVYHYQSEPLDFYFNELRPIVCAACGEQRADSSCRLRETSQCALDRYFGLVIDAINDVRDEIREELQTSS